MDSVPRDEQVGETHIPNDVLEEYVRLLAMSDYWRKKADQCLNQAIIKDKGRFYEQQNTNRDGI